LNVGVAATIANRNMYNSDDADGWYYGNFVGYYNNPRLRTTFNTNWTYGNWDTGFYINYVGGTDRLDGRQVRQVRGLPPGSVVPGLRSEREP
ncbi:hypothetical protein K9F17_20650, partial [Stenotrophomonas acidaminiphila]|nr:hypothetical protein [Stenotrophomonas acidaminiphila]